MDSASKIVIWALVACLLMIVAASIVGAFTGVSLGDKTLEWCGMILLALVGLLKNTDRPQPQDVTIKNEPDEPVPR